MRLPQMTTRRWMIAAAVFGILLGGVLEANRRYWIQYYRRMLKDDEGAIHWLDDLARKARQSEANGEAPIGGRTWPEIIDLYERSADNQRNWAAYRRSMIGRYGGDPDSK